MSRDTSDNLEAIDRQLAEFGLVDDDEQQQGEAADSIKDENVQVMVRCRPLLRPKERESCVEVDETNKRIQLDGRQFRFDEVFGPESDNERVYMRSVRRLVDSAFKGYNCTVFLYGQTGTGKTYTHSSLTQKTFEQLFALIHNSNTKSRFLIRASYYELYNEEIRDLLSSSAKQALELRESKARGVYVKDLTCYLVNNLGELEKLKKLGDKRRATAATRMNEYSSRSHSIFSLTIETVAAAAGDNNNGANSAKAKSLRNLKNPKPGGSAEAVRVGRVHLIDLAGSERQAKSGSTGVRLKEASQINLSLTCLSLVIRALTDSKSSHIPYRNSKLTRLLSSSLGGNSKTLLISCVSPARSNLDESLNTLRFAKRTKRIKNSASVNEDAKDALLRNYRRQIEELRGKLKSLASNQASEDDVIESLSRAHNDKLPAESDELARQLRLLRAKIMVGGENLLDKVEMHERLLEASRKELEEKRQEELNLKQRLRLKRENLEKVQQFKGSLEDQVDDLNHKLKRALLLYRQTKEERRDLSSEHQQLKDSLLQGIRATSKEIRYSDCIIDDFIPREYQDLINAYAQYDDESEEWQIKYIALSGNNIAQTKRAVA